MVGKEIAVDREVSGGGRGMTNSGDSCSIVAENYVLYSSRFSHTPNHLSSEPGSFTWQLCTLGRLFLTVPQFS